MARPHALFLALLLLAGYVQAQSSSYTSSLPSYPVGHARFFGPLAAGCQVDHAPYPENSTLSNTTTLGQLQSAGNATVTVSDCTDTFTGLPIPYPVFGEAPVENTTFLVSPITSIATSNSSFFFNETVLDSYKILGKNVNVNDLDVFGLLKAGSVSAAEAILITDLQYIAVSTIVAEAVMAVTNGTTDQCNTTAQIYSAFAQYISNQTSFSLTHAADIEAALDSFTTGPCNHTEAELALLDKSAVASASVLFATIAAETDITGGKWPLYDLVAMSRLASFIQSTSVSTLVSYDATEQSTVFHDLDAAPLQPEQICSALGIDGYISTEVNITVAYTGPLKGAALKYTPFTNLVQSTLPATNAAGVIKNAAATLGLYVIPAGATDILLTTNDSAPVTTSVPIACIAPFTSGAFTLSPIAAMILAEMQQRPVDSAPAVPNAASWKAAYDVLYGNDGLPNGTDYLARSYTQGSAIALSIAAIDTVLPAIPALGGVFISNAVNTSDISTVVNGLYIAMLRKNLTELCNATNIQNMLETAYNATGSTNLFANTTNSTSNSGTRRLLQASSFSTILGSIASAVAESSAMAADVLVKAQTAIATGTTPDASLFTTLAQVAKVQNTDLITAVQDVAAKVAAGDLTAAAAAATTVQTSFTGDALKAAVAQATVNNDALNTILGVSPTPSPTSPDAPVDAATEDKATHLGVGLGVGLGAGIPVVGAAVAGLFLWIKKRRGVQATAPAAPDSAA